MFVDPARISDWSLYAGATLLTPNRNELEVATGRELGGARAAFSDAVRAAAKGL